MPKKRTHTIVNHRTGVTVVGAVRVEGGWQKLKTNHEGKIVQETYFEPHWGIDNLEHEVTCPLHLNIRTHHG